MTMPASSALDKANLLRRDDLICLLVLEHAILVDATLMSKCICANNRLQESVAVNKMYSSAPKQRKDDLQAFDEDTADSARPARASASTLESLPQLVTAQLPWQRL